MKEYLIQIYDNADFIGYRCVNGLILLGLYFPVILVLAILLYKKYKKMRNQYDGFFDWAMSNIVKVIFLFAPCAIYVFFLIMEIMMFVVAITLNIVN